MMLRLEKSARLGPMGSWERIQLDHHWTVSIQGGNFAYSTPRQNRRSLTDYSKLEVAVFYDAAWVDPAAVGLDAWAAGTCGGGKGNAVAGYVPIAEVIALMDRLEGAAKPNARYLGYGPKEEGSI